MAWQCLLISLPWHVWLKVRCCGQVSEDSCTPLPVCSWYSCISRFAAGKLASSYKNGCQKKVAALVAPQGLLVVPRIVAVKGHKQNLFPGDP